MTTAESQIDDLVSSALKQSPYLSQRKLRFETQQGRVVLRGVVSSYYQKQMAQESLRGLQGIHCIENQLEVNWT